MCVPSYFPSGTHEVHVTWPGFDSWGNPLPERIYTFDVVNPLYGQYGDDPDNDQFKIDYPDETVAYLQDGR